MQRVCLILLTFLFAFVHSHTYLSSLTIDGIAYTEGDCIRPYISSASVSKNDAITDVTSPNMTCGWLPDSANAANRKCAVNPGSMISMQWHQFSDASSDPFLSPEDVGPCLVYMAASSTGAGSVWFKVWEQGYDAKSDQWCTQSLKNSNGAFSFEIPTDIAPGNYLLRGEILSLSGASIRGGAQSYTLCAELVVSGTGTAIPTGVSIPGAYSFTDAGILVDLANVTRYVVPGPPVYKAGSPIVSGPTQSAAPTSAPVNANTSNSIKISVHPQSNVYWIALQVDSGDDNTTSIWIKDTSMTAWAEMKLTTWQYWVYNPLSPLAVPISLRLGDSAGNEVTLIHVIASLSNFATIDTRLSYGGSDTSEEFNSGGTNSSAHEETVQIVLHPASSLWWLAAAIVNGYAAKFELKDSSSGLMSNWNELQVTNWGYYTFATSSGSALQLPISIRATSQEGVTAEATFNDISTVPVDTGVSFA